ncbi:prolyl 4-hydroxylase subunit alpha-1-like [Drosophila willistoni]|uniref:prolyl 4-hydroxylase subunit alpha-1-like n=1 Tax=Drosophila willistoni TaxID=7260 RepID=UPI001F07470A|nr:prolyl 4-hydroxylase subunit alpha-1-like [Drosophila willistoni]
MKSVCCVLFILWFIIALQAEPNDEKQINRHHYSRSINAMINLLYLSDTLAFNLDLFRITLTNKIAVINLGIENMKARHKKAAQNTSDYLENSLNSFSLLRHMQSDWLYWQLYMENADSFQLSYMEEVKSYQPQSNDFIDAAESLRRLQKVYQMSSLDMANGLLDGVQYKSTFTPLDCFALAKYNSDNRFWQTAEQWLNATISRFGQPNHRPEIHKLHGLRLDAVYDELARVRLNQNKYAEALHAQRKALELAPRDANLLHKFHSLQTHILTFPSFLDTSFENNVTAFDAGVLPYCCNGKCQVSKELKLYCLYNTKDSYFLRIAPVKMEVLSLDPYIVLYHDFILSSEQEFLKAESIERLSVAETVDPDTGKWYADASRTAKAMWFYDTSSVVIRRINQRIEEITNLDPEKGDLYQIISYGIGGLFQTHYDYLHENENRRKGFADRMSTFVFYLQDVPQGGATLFNNISLSVFPKAGAALFWYNLNNAGDTEWNVAHTGCPVIVGSKWIMTKWIQDVGQEFRKPCLAI